MPVFNADNASADQTSCSAASDLDLYCLPSDLGLHCLPITFSGISRLKLVKSLLLSETQGAARHSKRNGP